MSEMTDHSGMPMDARADASALARCHHCHSHTQSHGCSGLLHGCHAQHAAARPSSLTLRVMQLQVALHPVALPHITTLAFDPPLRPPPV